jgi:anaerobic ribonucleoside-triphosphate reductase activating protein
MHRLSVYHIGTAENVLGFGKRIIIWFAGCPFNCFNCIEDKLRDINSGKLMPVSQVYELIKPLIETHHGITFSGGEPLFQPEGLIELLTLLPTGTDKMLFTGYEPEELNEVQKKCYSHFDLAVTGRFENDKRGSFLWRGSLNKKFYSPTGKYSKEYLKVLYNKESAGLEITVTDGNLLFYGIPTQNDEIDKVMNKLKKEDIILSEVIMGD